MSKKQNEINVPELRFPKFKGEWSVSSIDDIVERISDPVDVDPDQEYREIGVRSHGKGVFHKDYITGKDIGNKRVFWVKPNAFVVNIVFGWEQAVALTSDSEEGMIASHRFPMYIPKDNKIDLEFLLTIFLRKQGKYLLELASPGGAGRNKTLGQKEFAKLEINHPSIDEQSKISNFIKTVDEKLKRIRRKAELLRLYKRGVMHKIFSRQIRFKQDNGHSFSDWEKVKLKDVFKRVTRKNYDNNQNVLTISAQYGLINQEEFFNKSVAANDVRGYYQLHEGEFAYNKSYSNGYPMGAIKRLNKYSKGVVSTLYICFKTNKKSESCFYEKYFDSGYLNYEIKKIAQEGARNHGLLNISIVEFFNDINIYRPSDSEQRKITNLLSIVESKIEIIDKKIATVEKFKKSLLQKMFV